MRIVEVEEYLDAKSDDTMMGVREEKDTLSLRFPVVGSRFGKPRWQKKKKKTVGPKSPTTKRETKILFSLHALFLEKEILSPRDTLFVVGACKKKCKYCSG